MKNPIRISLVLMGMMICSFSFGQEFNDTKEEKKTGFFNKVKAKLQSESAKEEELKQNLILTAKSGGDANASLKRTSGLSKKMMSNLAAKYFEKKDFEESSYWYSRYVNNKSNQKRNMAVKPFFCDIFGETI